MDRWVAARHNSATAEENGTEEPVGTWALRPQVCTISHRDVPFSIIDLNPGVCPQDG